MKQFTIAAVCIIAAFLTQLSSAAQMIPVGPVTIEGTIQSISWHPDKLLEAMPYIAGGIPARTVLAHYKLTLKDTKVTSKRKGYIPFTSGEPISLKLNHPKDDNFLEQCKRVRIIDFHMEGDEGGIYTYYTAIEILDEKETKPSNNTDAGDGK